MPSAHWQQKTSQMEMGDAKIERLMAEGAAWPEDRAIEVALTF
jgi:hypothetical protein